MATYGFTVDGAGLFHEESGLAVTPWTPSATNNVAEYTAAIRGLEWLRAQSYDGLVILIGDSQLVLRQMRGEYAVRASHLRAYHERLGQLAGGFEGVRYVWVPREQNARADALSKIALEEARARSPPPGPSGGEEPSPSER